ncbi:MAG: hypothetical protein L0227_16160 [Chloroflexi bacterium]|nr:hypothetical protein [Chloroflexota bacterium]
MTVLVWIVSLAEWFFAATVMNSLWILAFALWAGTGALALTLTLVVLFLLLRRRRYAAAVAIVAVAALVSTTVLLIPWRDAFPTVWFTTHRAQFARAADLAASGALGEGLDEYVGAALPADVRAISVSGTLVRIQTFDSEDGVPPGECEPALFAPAAFGIPDGAIGFVHLSCAHPPSDFFLDAYADGIVPRIELGDGWWWADGG